MGHVAVVESVDPAAQTVTVGEMNYSRGAGLYDQRTAKISSFTGFILPPVAQVQLLSHSSRVRFGKSLRGFPSWLAQREISKLAGPFGSFLEDSILPISSLVCYWLSSD